MLAAIKRACRNSWTVVLARATTLFGVVASIAGAVWGDPTVNGAIQQIVPADAWPFVVILFGLLIEAARYLPHRNDGTMD